MSTILCGCVKKGQTDKGTSAACRGACHAHVWGRFTPGRENGTCKSHRRGHYREAKISGMARGCGGSSGTHHGGPCRPCRGL